MSGDHEHSDLFPWWKPTVPPGGCDRLFEPAPIPLRPGVEIAFFTRPLPGSLPSDPLGDYLTEEQARELGIRVRACERCGTEMTVRVGPHEHVKGWFVYTCACHFMQFVGRE